MTTIAAIIAAMLLLSLASFFMLSGSGPVEEAATALAEERIQTRLDLAQEAKAAVSTYAWADKEAQKVRLPLEVAIKNMAPRLAALKPSPSGELAPLAPGPSDAPVLRSQPAPPGPEETGEGAAEPDSEGNTTSEPAKKEDV